MATGALDLNVYEARAAAGMGAPGAYHAATADVVPEGRCKMMPPSS